MDSLSEQKRLANLGALTEEFLKGCSVVEMRRIAELEAINEGLRNRIATLEEENTQLKESLNNLDKTTDGQTN